MKKFDFNHPDFLKHSTGTQSYLLQCYHAATTLDEFIIGWKQCHQHVRGRKRAHYSPSGCKRVYEQLSEKFNFFGKE